MPEEKPPILKNEERKYTAALSYIFTMLLGNRCFKLKINCRSLSVPIVINFVFFCRLLEKIKFPKQFPLVGVPIWWKTTEVYRANLPYADIGKSNIIIVPDPP